MSILFVGGSRKISRLDAEVSGMLDGAIARGSQIIVGDANGSDKATQLHLAARKYRSVTVYFTSERCRNNAGHWNARSIPSRSNRKRTDFDFHTAKDDAMILDADDGLMIWDGRSRGTLRNVLHLARLNKPTLLYFSPQRRFIAVNSIENLRQVLSICEPEAAEALRKKLSLGDTSEVDDPQLLLPL